MSPGQVQVWDLERLDAAVFTASSGSKGINGIDGCGAQVTCHVCKRHLHTRCKGHSCSMEARLACMRKVLNKRKQCMQAAGRGLPELATAGGDGAARVWDARQPEAPIAEFCAAQGAGKVMAGMHLAMAQHMLAVCCSLPA